MDKKQALAYIDQNAKIFTDVSDKVWEFAELSLMEHRSAAEIAAALEAEGFKVERGIANIDTAFTGTYGEGKPVIAILGEFDALSGLSQEPGIATRKELVKGGNGHGCGHHLLGAGSLAAAFAIKKYLQESGKPGTVVYYGCPGEEGGASKAFMARDGVFEGLDIALSWHPGDVTLVSTGTCNTSMQIEYSFEGIAAHAAGDPHLGRSALDAVELMNVGVQFLREHMPRTDAVHYAITDAGGNSPNVVQPRARVLYMVRSTNVPGAIELIRRVGNIAQAAALMTDTKVTSRFIDGTADLVPNKALEELLYQNCAEIGVPSYTEEEKAYAASIMATYENPDPNLPGLQGDEDEDMQEYVALHSKNGTIPLNDFLIPYKYSKKIQYGSTDVGDVSWLVPTAQIRAVCWASKSPGHSWQNVTVGKSSFAHKGLLYAGKVLAAAAIDLLENPELIKAAKAEFDKVTAKQGGYVCPIPKDAVPTSI